MHTYKNLERYVKFKIKILPFHKFTAVALKMGFITPEGFAQLDRYKYVSGGYSFLDNIFNHYWEAVARLMPMVFSQILF